MKKVYIWGTGNEADKCISNINLEHCQIMGYIETKPRKQKWRNGIVYSADFLSMLQYDYILIANTYYDEILGHIKKNGLADESKIINWVKLRECIYYYSKDIWALFTDKFVNENFYILNNNTSIFGKNFAEKILKYNKLYIYDLRLINSELDIGLLMHEIINNLRNAKVGMVFIPGEQYFDEIWYHNLLHILDMKAFVVWSEIEGIFKKIIKEYPGKFSFSKFSILQFKRTQLRPIHNGRYMMFDTKLVYEQKRDLIYKATQIKIFYLRCDRIGEEIRVYNNLLFKDEKEKDIFELYIPVDAYSKPFIGTNACFNEVLARKINLLRNKDEYSLWIKDIFENSEKYEHDFQWINAREFKSGLRQLGQPVLDFNSVELEYFKKFITDRLGLQKDYVCLYTRDEMYLKSIFPDIDASYHNYRDSTFDVMNKAIDYFENCGIQTVRMGQIIKSYQQYGSCICFAEQGYDETIDLILHRFCKFFIGSAAGIGEIPNIFGKPIVWLLPYYPLIDRGLFYVKEDFGIVSRVYNVDEKRELSFSEIFDVTYEFKNNGLRGEYFSEHSLQLIPFSQDDVRDAAIEMNMKLDGTWKYHEKDKELQDSFEYLLKLFFDKNQIDPSEMIPIPIATSFLRKYQYLI